MRVSLTWLKQLVDLKLSPKELSDKLSLMTIGVKEQTDDFLELDLTYNRGDLLSMRGVAREIAAITDSALVLENPAPAKSNLPKVSVQVTNEKLSPVYCVAKIEGLKVSASADEWTKRLADTGIRSINNVADITNLIMLEYGQPMHAFDAAKVADETLVVRTAKVGETLLTLDNKTRKLDPTDLLIADTKQPLGLAGVMGGKDSEISDQTTTIFLEAAIFDPINNRNTSKRHGLYSEASKRFQHGLTKTNLQQALSRAIKMYEGLGGKLTALTLTGDLQDLPKQVNFDPAAVNRLIGVEISKQEMETSLKALGFDINGNQATVPYWRLDINIEEDLIEEVARMYGYEKIANQALQGDSPDKLDESLQDLVYSLKNVCKNAGLTEVQTYPFFSSRIIENCKLKIENLIRIANPISSETEYLRQSLWPNLVEVIGKNLRQGFSDIVIFEIGKAYYVEDSKIKEEYRLAIALCNNTDNPLAELSQIAEKLRSHLSGVNLKQAKPEGIAAKLSHPTRYFELEKDGKQVGGMSEVHLRLLHQLGVEKRVAIMEVAF